MPTATYGSWPSPITTGTITARTVLLSQVRVDGPDTYWVERRATQEGRQVLLRRSGDGTIGEILPLTPDDQLVDVRTLVHEYGGKAYAVSGGIIVVSHAGDSRLYLYNVEDRMRGLVPLTIYGDVRHGDIEIDRDRGLLYAVREDHRSNGEAVNSLVAVPLDGSAARDDEPVKTVFSGTDFVSSPALSPDGQHLAWLSWNHPNMPWDETTLHVADLNDDGTIGEHTIICEGKGVSAVEPRWTQECDLIHASNHSGFWNLYRTEGFPVLGASAPGWTKKLRTRSLHPKDATFSLPAWYLGPHSYDILDGDRLIASWTQNAIGHLGTIKLANGELEEWVTGWQPMGNVASADGRVVMLATSEVHLPSIVEVKNGSVQVLRGSGEFDPDTKGISLALPVQWPTTDGATSHGFYYEPANAEYTGEDGTKPPLIVNVHSGPTTASHAGYDLEIQYWTSRGFAYLDVNYRGSTGYGTKYRKALDGKWGIVDVDDCVSGAQYIVDQGWVDPERVAIRGHSGGGFTVLSALTRSTIFSAAASMFGVADLGLLARTTHKFESHYIPQLVGAHSVDDPLLLERSPISHVESIHAPLLLIQGTNDPVVPAEQATTMFDAVASKGLPVAIDMYPGEGHGFRLASNIRKAFDAELSFYCQVWGITPGEELSHTVTVENLEHREQ